MAMPVAAPLTANPAISLPSAPSSVRAGLAAPGPLTPNSARDRVLAVRACAAVDPDRVRDRRQAGAEIDRARRPAVETGGEGDVVQLDTRVRRRVGGFDRRPQAAFAAGRQTSRSRQVDFVAAAVDFELSRRAGERWQRQGAERKRQQRSKQ